MTTLTAEELTDIRLVIIDTEPQEDGNPILSDDQIQTLYDSANNNMGLTYIFWVAARDRVLRGTHQSQ